MKQLTQYSMKILVSALTIFALVACADETEESVPTGGMTGGMTGGVTGGMTGGVTGDMTGGMTGGVTGGDTGGVTGGVTGGMTGGMTGGTSGEGNASCTAILQCVNACEDQACFQGCFQQGDATGQSLFNDLLSCVQSSAASNGGPCADDDFQCQNAACENELNACVGEQPDLPTGNLDCSGINDCLGTCGPMDATCQQGCIGQGTAEAQMALFAVVDCFNAAVSSGQCGDQDIQCMNMVCQTEVVACLGASGGGGPGACLDSCDPTASTCADGLFCLDIGGAAICAAGTMDAPMFPQGAVECTSDTDCGPNQLCVSGG